jgi:hypothetical protein
MNRVQILVPALLGWMFWVGAANAQLLIGGSVNNGNLDRSHATEIVPGFFLPKPDVWVYQGSRAISGPYQDGISSEPWAGPAPTPVTTDGNLNAPPPDGHGGPDGGVFYKAFTGNATDGAATVHLSQTFPAVVGARYTLSGWAGAEANFLGTGEFGIDFLNGANGVIGGNALNLNTSGLFVPNGQPFNYKQYTLDAVAPPGAVSVRARTSLLNGLSNPAGGGQAYVVDDFVFVPEPAALTALALIAAGAALRRRVRQDR